MACLRCALAAVVLAVLMRATRQAWPARAHWISLTVLSLLTVVTPFVLFNWAGLVLPAGYSAVLNATAPLFGVLAGALFKEERLTLRKLLGCAAGVGGVALLVRLGPVQPDARVVLAVLACVAASASYGFGAILMKRATLVLQPLPASAAVHAAGALVLLLPAGGGVPAVQLRTEALLAIAVLGMVTSGFMYWISMRLMREIPASAANLLGLHDPDVRRDLGRPVPRRALHARHAARRRAGTGGLRLRHRLQPAAVAGGVEAARKTCSTQRTFPGGIAPWATRRVARPPPKFALHADAR
jgi:drug/metabolite transporter (DMT)-like permease